MDGGVWYRVGMGTKTLPSKTITTCDACGKDNAVVDIFRDGCKLSVIRVARDWHGAAVADASVHRDLCDDCTEKVVEAINSACDKAAEPRDPPGFEGGFAENH